MQANAWPARTLSLVIAALPLSGCVTASSSKPQASVIVRCGTVTPFSKSDQQKAVQELELLPQDSVIANKFMPDHLRMRREARACAKGKKK
jgi:hypothetical protein